MASTGPVKKIAKPAKKIKRITPYFINKPHKVDAGSKHITYQKNTDNIVIIYVWLRVNHQTVRSVPFGIYKNATII